MAMLPSSGTKSEMNVTPYIDVLLVLLITFMLLTQRLVTRFNLAQEGGGNSGTRSIMLELTDDGRYLLNTVAVPAESLATKLHEAYAVRNDKILFLKAGNQRRYRDTIEAIDIAKGAGVEVVALAP